MKLLDKYFYKIYEIYISYKTPKDQGRRIPLISMTSDKNLIEQ